MDNEETQVIDPSEEEVLDFTYSITSYGADYPVDSLVNRLRSNKIKTPSFQRGFVWSGGKASRFIESLLLGLPVPGIFLSKDTDSPDLLVIDGQQRLKSLLFFYDGLIGDTAFKLKDVQDKFEGKAYKDLKDEDKQRLDDSIIHATIVKQDEPSEDNSSIYLIFERLNTGGMLLQPQEIRSAIYQGQFADLLKKLNDYPAWREIYGNRSTRLKDQEFILRFFAMFFFRDEYEKPLKGFLNTYMAKNRNLKLNDEKQLTKIFTKTVTYVASILGKKAFRPVRAINASVFDSMMVGIARMLSDNAKLPEKQIFLDIYNSLLNNKDYLVATTDATSDEPVVEKRMSLAIEAFSNINNGAK
jgi:uncharacterized protein with ParB-like and HNH nuclease domain